ncbi:MAG: STAS/SEC14 domain-containing protein [Myxococcales bacterium]
MEGRVVQAHFAMARVGSVLVTAIGQGDLTDDEIGEMIKRFDVKDFQTLLFAARGAGPNSKQRGRIADYWKKSWAKTPRTGLVTDSTAARFVAQAFAWLLNNEMKAFPSAELDAAVAYLASTASVAEVAGAIAALHTAVEFKQRRAG